MTTIGLKDTLTEAEAKALAGTRFWEDMDARQIAEFQLNTDRLCMPFGVFREAMEEALGRPVWTHEYARPDLLGVELRGDAPAPTFQQILDLIPEDKRIVIGITESEDDDE